MQFLERIPRAFAREHIVLGEAMGGESDAVARIIHAERTDPLILHNIAVRLGATSAITHAIADPEWIARRIDEAYAQYENNQQGGGGAATRADREGVATIALGDDHPALDSGLDDELSRLASTAGSDRDLLSLGDKGPVIRLVDGVLFEAIGRGASDIHIQPLAESTLIRFRIDGVLLTARRVPPRLAPAIVSRIKVMARLDVAERRAAQDGRATVTIGGGGGGRGSNGPRASRGAARAIDLRIATLPSAYGERVVIRLLDTQRGQSLATLDAIGMPEDVASSYRDRAGRSSGIVLVTGPTGSGKTTTLYATLRYIAARTSRGAMGASRAAASDVNVMTIEDPIEYDLTSVARPQESGASAPSASESIDLPICQTQVDPKKNLTFSTGLRHILRQDPDVIMVGEIRDLDTARIAIQASLTGHLVFSTLHTADAPGAVTRLLDLGIEPYLVASSLSCVLAQRLVRLLHAECSGQGCPECLHSGFKGRRGIFELLVVEAAVRELIATGATATVIRDAAMARGMRRLEDQGAQLVRENLTTIDEVRRVTLGAEG